ncbi:hypothetical protein FWK35_00003367 [Aphis craccivora]|uniref:Uncharacterized protein n=1 Tax=Aphis craccivora TaxID=307492 RepID=A0A6G0ZEN6_APHCR|nr:hypothetical protein FWK35_00003367 [Aphis craccivora]
MKLNSIKNHIHI